MTTSVGPKNAVMTTPAGEYRFTYWKCVNWHNLLSQEGPLEGDIFNLGPNESGKTTWLDGLHAALTLGEPHMEWNSAADPAISESKLRARGRTINDILFRATLDGPSRSDPQISYFLVELTNASNGDIVSVGVGAFATHYEAEPERWGIIIHKSLREVQLREPATPSRIYDYSRLEQLYGRECVLKPPRFRKMIADLLFGNLERYDQVLTLLNLGKSYSRLSQRNQRCSDLFSRVLPEPNPRHFEDARTDLRSIQSLDTHIRASQEVFDGLQDVAAAVRDVNRNAAAIRRYTYRRAIFAHDDASQKLQRLVSDLKTAEAELADSQRKLADAETRREASQRLVTELAASEAAELVRSVALARQELEQATGKRHERQATHKKAMDATKVRQAEHDASWQEFRDSAAHLSQTINRAIDELPDWVPTALRVNLDRIARALSQAQPDLTELPADVEQARGLANDLIRRLADDQTQVIANARAEAKPKRAEVESLQSRLAALEAARDIPPMEDSLPRALEGIEKDVWVLYRQAEVLPDREMDARLLEAYLPRNVLAAILPRRPTDLDRIRRHVQRRTRDVKVVNVSELPPPDLASLPSDSILRVLDLTKTEPIAFAYLLANYGDVHLLSEGANRGDIPRVIWRDGEVYDGHAWHLEISAEGLEYFGLGARKRRLEAFRATLREQIRELNGRVLALDREAEGAEARKVRLQALQSTLERGFQVARLHDCLQRFHDARTHLATAASVEARELAAVNEARRELEKRQTIWSSLDAQVRETGAEEVRRRLELAQAHVQTCNQEQTIANKDYTRAQTNVEALQTTLDETRSEARHAEDEREHRRKELLAVGPREGFTEADFEVYLQQRGFYTTKPANLDGLESQANQEMGRGREKIQNLCLALANRRALQYSDDSNTVLEAVTRVPLTDLVGRLELELESKRRELVAKTKELSQQVFVQRIASNLKQEVAEMEDRIDRVNAELARSPFRGAVFRIKCRALRSDPEVDRMRTLVLEASAEANSAMLGEFMLAMLRRTDLNSDQVPPLFDYRKWYEFRMVRADPATGKEVDEEQFAKASGGGQALPRYLFCFSLFRTLYDQCDAKLRLVLIDEAFLRMDRGNIDQLIAFGKGQTLLFVVTNTELDGATDAMESGTVQMFNKNSRNETLIGPWSYDRRAPETPIATR